MKKSVINCILLVFLLLPTVFYAQKYGTRTGTVKFEASVSSFEEVAAEHTSVSAVLNASTGDFAVLALMTGFRFKIALMEEHFNENYVESDKYPKATFKGKIENLDVKKLSATPNKFTIKGELTLHGKTKQITDIAMISKSGNMVTITGAFNVKPADFDIEVPKVVRNKVAETVAVTYHLSLSE
ncbi:YceI family protein [Flavobacterium salilacus subsp. salilacus]|uniref:YceI family protein n=1 Tax=Flavobacterium TaxID=237 RepID=UPI00107539BB|nr:MULTISPECIES: YceI family protein [Flavobacterium]KAF2515826.1 YceI family protein [Flavobacterium salilacus subsp. salilacus]MBE1615370.1 YceI family protein [Flavobacterium sp. SaA2.13]